MSAILRDLELKIACAAFMLTLVMVTANVLLRYLSGTSLLFSEEISYLGFAYTIFLGAAYLYRKRVMIAVDFVIHMMPSALRRATVFLTLLLLLAANCYLVYISILLVDDGWVRRTAYLQMPYAYIHSASTIGFALMAVYSALFLSRLLSGRDLDYAEAADQV